MKTNLLVVFTVLSITLLLSGCLNNSDDDGTPSGNGDDEVEVKDPETFRLLVSDQPADIGDFDSVEVTFSKFRVFRIGAPENESAWLEEPVSSDAVDLKKLTGELTYLLLEIDLDAGEYSKLELYVGAIEAKIDNETVEVKVPSGKLMITKPFTITDNSTISFVFDINIVKKGTGDYNLQPVISESGVVGIDIAKEKIEECDARGEACKAFEVVEAARELNREKVKEKAKEINEGDEEGEEEKGKPGEAGKPEGVGSADSGGAGKETGKNSSK